MEQLFFLTHVLTIFKSPWFIKYYPRNCNLIKLLFGQKYNHWSYSHFLNTNWEIILNLKKKKSSHFFLLDVQEQVYLKAESTLKVTSLFLGWRWSGSNTRERKMRKTWWVDIFFAIEGCDSAEKFLDRKFPWGGPTCFPREQEEK